MRIRSVSLSAALAVCLSLALPVSSYAGDTKEAVDSAVTAAKEKAVDALKEKAADAVKGKAGELAGNAAGEPASGAAAMPEMSPEMAAMFEAYSKAGELRPEHEPLKFFAGQWTVAVSMWFGPGEPSTSEARASSSMTLGGRYAHMHYEGEFMGEPFHGLGYTGYDNLKQQYVNLWADSASTTFVVIHGDYDSENRTYSFEGTMPNPLDPASPTPMREVIRVVSDDQYTLEWFETHEGEEVRTMLLTFNRVVADSG